MMAGKLAGQPRGCVVASGEATMPATHEVGAVQLLCGEILAGKRPAEPLRLTEIDGVFSCVLRHGGRAWAYRDPSGLCSLFACRRTDGRWQAAGSLEALARGADAPLDIEPRALHEYLRLLDISAPNSWLRGTRAVEPGQFLDLDSGDPAAHLPGMQFPAGQQPAADFGEAVAALERGLHSSVARCLSGAVRPAAFLSSGIDSALLCTVAARHRPDLTAVTVGFEGAGFDEAPVAARIAQHLGIAHRVLRFGRRDYLEAFERLARGMDQPMADPATMATVLAFEHCREHFDVVLDGTGADEAVGVMPPRHARLAVGAGSLVPAPLRRALVAMMRRVPVLAGYTPIFDFEHPAEVLMRWKGFTRTEIEALCGEPVALEGTAFYRTFARFARRAHYERYSALSNVMPCDRLTQAMRLTGMRVRFPYFARDVDAFLRQLPTHWRHLPSQPKRILHELLARCVPREIWDRPKQGFTFPLHDFLAGDDHALVRHHLLEGRWLARGVLDAPLVRRYAQRYMAGERQLMFRVWALVVLGAWLDAHDDIQPATARA